MALTKVTGQVINNTTGLVVGVTTVGGGVSATDGFFSGIVTAVGNASFSGNVSVGGTLTYEDVTNIDAVGLVTARNGIVVGSGITLSKDGDIFATGITTISENLKVGAGITLSPDGDGFYTGVVTATSYRGDGSNLTGVSADVVDDTSPQLGGDLDLNGNKISVGDGGRDANQEHIRFGADGDLRVYHTADGDSTIEHNSSGTDLIIKTTSAADDVLIQPQDDFLVQVAGATKNSIIARNDGATELYWQGGSAGKKLETTTSGVTVTGEVSATSFSGIGAITMFDSCGLSGSTTYSSNNYITNDWTRRTGTHGGNIGNAMTESAGVFTFPQTGFYYISMQFGGYTSAGTQPYFGVKLTLSTDGGSSYSNVSNYYTSMQNSQYGRLSCQEVIDVTDASQFKIKFQLEVANNISIQGGQGRTSIFFIRYGDT